MTGRNWVRLRNRSRMARRGVESVKTEKSVVAPLLRKRWRQPLSKTELRAAAAKAFAEWRTRHE